MLKKERQLHILELLDEHRFLTNKELAHKLNVSEMTIRRDIDELSKYKKLIRVYGGVEKLKSKGKELSTKEKIDQHIEEKKQIGKIMNSLIQEDTTIYLGAGTTIYYALPELKKEKLFVITNSLICFQYLIAHTDYKVMLTGGYFNKTTEEFIGEVAEQSFANFNIHIAFIATNGIFNNNITTSSPQEGSIQKKVMENSLTKVLVADHSKFNVADTYTFEHLTNLDYVITDDKLMPQIEDHYAAYTKIIKEEF